MTIFVERSLVQLNAQALEELVSHLKLNYTAVIAEESQLYIFEEVISQFKFGCAEMYVTMPKKIYFNF